MNDITCSDQRIYAELLLNEAERLEAIRIQYPDWFVWYERTYNRCLSALIVGLCRLSMRGLSTTEIMDPDWYRMALQALAQSEAVQSPPLQRE